MPTFTPQMDSLTPLPLSPLLTVVPSLSNHQMNAAAPLPNFGGQTSDAFTASPPPAIRARIDASHLPLGIELSHEQQKSEKGKALCKVLGCSKLTQSNNNGFCRAHFNLLASEEELANDGSSVVESQPWTCKCGRFVPAKQKRCGQCHCWKGGVREPYIVSKKTERHQNGDAVKEVKTQPKLHAVGQHAAENFWTCDCGNIIDQRKSRCGKCHHWKGGKRVGGWKLGMKPYIGIEDDTFDLTVDWICCDESLPGKQTRCGKCHRWRGGKRKIRWLYHGLPSAAPVETSVDTSVSWECPKCHNVNKGVKKRCSGCSTWRFTRKKSRSSMPAPFTVETGVEDTNQMIGSQGLWSTVKAEEEENPMDNSHAEWKVVKTEVEENTMVDDAHGAWKCTACYCDNFPVESKCILCHTPRPYL